MSIFPEKISGRLIRTDIIPKKYIKDGNVYKTKTENFNDQLDEDMSKYLVGTKILIIVASIILIGIVTFIFS